MRTGPGQSGCDTGWLPRPVLNAAYAADVAAGADRRVGEDSKARLIWLRVGMSALQ